MNHPFHRRVLTTAVLRVCLAGTAVVAALVPALAHAVGPLLRDSEAFAGGSVIEGQNLGEGGTGILGQSMVNGGNGVVGSAITTTARVGSVGVRGTANASSGYGVYGSGASPNSSSPSIGVAGISTGTWGIYGTTQSALYAAILGFNPTSTTGIGVEGYASGNGVLGISGNSNGVVGQTLVNTNGFAGQSGVMGQDLSTDGGDANAGVSGGSNHGTGVGGYSGTGSGLYGNSTTGDGVQGVSISGDGMFGESTSSSGMMAMSYATPAPAPTSSSSPAPAAPPVLGIDSAMGAPAIEAVDSNGDPIFSLDGSGNMILSGNLTVDGTVTGTNVTTCGASPCVTPLVRAQKTAANVAVGTYAPEQTVRTLEDVGEAQLVNGSAYVRMDAAFASAVDQKSSYLVFITPQGDTRGLYVTGKTRAGFTVRETENGHSSLAFDYRIAAKPYGDTDARLPVLAANANRGHLPRPLAIPRALLRVAQLQSKRPLHMPTHSAGFIPKAPRPLVQPIAIR